MSSDGFRGVVNALRSSPCRMLDNACPIALDAFFCGYWGIDQGIKALISEALSDVEGPSGLSPCARVYLAMGQGQPSFKIILDRIDETLLRMPPVEEAGPYSGFSFIQLVGDSIRKGRLGIVLGEPTVSWLQNYYSGFESALANLNPDLFTEESERMKAFNLWLQQRYRIGPSSCWRAIRTFEGAGETGVHAFVKLWDQFQAVNDNDGQ